MFEHLDDENIPRADSDTVDAVVDRAAGLRRRSLLTRSAVATVAVVALVGVAAGAAALSSDDSGTRTAAANADELEAPGEPEVGTPPPSTAPPITAQEAPSTTAPTEVAGEQLEAPSAPSPTTPAPAAPAPAPTGSYQGTVVAPSGWTVDITVSGPGGSWSYSALTNGSPFSQAGVKAGTYTLEWTAESPPAPPGPGDAEIGTAMRVGRQQFTVSKGQTTSVTVVV